MKTEHYKELEKKFYLGETTPEEEKLLKELDNDSLLNVLKEEKNETMDWNFDDFLAKVEETPKTAPIIPLNTKRNRTQKYTWIAASLILLFGAYVALNYNSNDIQTTDQTIAQEINNQKTIFEQENNIVSNEDENNDDNVEDNTENSYKEIKSTPEKSIVENDVLDEILPKKGRIQKQSKPKYTSNTKDLDKSSTIPEYQSNYVIINGQKITSEKEAIELTQYSFQMISDKMSKTIANTVTLENPTDY